MVSRLTVNYVNFVNFKSNSLWKTGSLLVLGILVLSSGALAQAPKYVPPPPPTKHAKLELRLRYLLTPSIEFSGLGSVPFLGSYESPGNLVEGTERTILYDDGYLIQDFIAKSLIDGEPVSQFVPSSDGSATANFGYQNPDQVDREGAPSTLNFHRYAASYDPTVQFEGSGSGSMGWELNYTKFINRRRNLGIQVGFSFNGFDSRFNDSIEADLHTLTFSHDIVDGEVPELVENVDDDGNVTYTPYTGDRVRGEDDEVDLLQWETNGDPVEELLEGGATVESRVDLRSSMYNFRAGTTYALSLGEAFSFQFGAGVSAMYVSGRLSAYEILINTGASENPSRAMTTTEEAEWQVGGYLDANAYYNFTERVSFFSGMQLQSGSSYTQQNEERQATVDFSSQVYVHAGLGIKF